MAYIVSDFVGEYIHSHKIGIYIYIYIEELRRYQRVSMP